MQLSELTEREAREINGGIIPLAVAWGIFKICAYVTVAGYGVGMAIGTAHGHYSNNNPPPAPKK
jgi:lactobin A/cerein 7B family class IIb bacteriocin